MPGMHFTQVAHNERRKDGRLFFRLFQSSIIPIFHSSIMSSNLSEVHTSVVLQ